MESGTISVERQGVIARSILIVSEPGKPLASLIVFVASLKIDDSSAISSGLSNHVDKKGGTYRMNFLSTLPCYEIQGSGDPVKDTPAVQNAINAMWGGGGGGTIRLIGGIALNAITWPSPPTGNTPYLKIEIDGRLTLTTTFDIPDCVSLEGQAGGRPIQFQIGNCAEIVPPPAATAATACQIAAKAQYVIISGLQDAHGTGLITASLLGEILTLTGCASARNNGNYKIISLYRNWEPTDAVKAIPTSGQSPTGNDANNGRISWSVTPGPSGSAANVYNVYSCLEVNGVGLQDATKARHHFLSLSNCSNATTTAFGALLATREDRSPIFATTRRLGSAPHIRTLVARAELLHMRRSPHYVFSVTKRRAYAT
jgi:hypothetical protein